MFKPRLKNDGLPFRLYERRGVKYYSIGYKGPQGKWLFRDQCLVSDLQKIRDLRRDAITKANSLNQGGPKTGTFGALVDAWFERQEKLPIDSEERRAKTTLDENRREAANLKKAFGDLPVSDLQKADAYEYLDACLVALDKKGNARPRPEKGNKEIALGRLILEYGIRLRLITENPFADVTKLRTYKEQRYVTDDELALAVEIGRKRGGATLIVGLALKTAFLCVRRSVEVRGLTRDQITEEGIIWTAAKRQKGQQLKRGLIEWSSELRETIDEALAIKRNHVAGTMHVFGNMRGQIYTKGGWKKTLSVLMTACEEEAVRRNVLFSPFSLQDCRPKGVSDKLSGGATDVIDATLHTSERMVRQVYDRRQLKTAKPVR
jgi:integrase